MDITLSDDQALIAETAQAFARDAITPVRIRGLETTEDGFDRDLWRRMAEMGWAGAVFPEEHGGADLGLMELALIIEALGSSAVPSPPDPPVTRIGTFGESGIVRRRAAWSASAARATCSVKRTTEIASSAVTGGGRPSSRAW